MSSRTPNGAFGSDDFMANSAFLHILQGFLLFLSYQENRLQRRDQAAAPSTANGDDSAVESSSTLDSISARLDTIANILTQHHNQVNNPTARVDVSESANVVERERVATSNSSTRLNTLADFIMNHNSVPFDSSTPAPILPTSSSLSGENQVSGANRASNTGETVEHSSAATNSNARSSSIRSYPQLARRTGGAPSLRNASRSTARLLSPYASPPPSQWFAVFRGREVGIFSDRRSVMRATRFLPMARFRAYSCEEHARRAFECALGIGIVRIMSNAPPEENSNAEQCNTSTIANASCTTATVTERHSSEELTELSDLDEEDELDESMELVPDSDERLQDPARKQL